MTKKLYIATPSYEGRVNVDYLYSFAETIHLLKLSQIDVEYQVRKSSTLLPCERNILFEAFYQSNATHMLCVDADIGWTPQDVVRMMNHDLDIVCATYRSRLNQNFVHVGSAEPKTTESGLMSVDYVGLGFVVISRSAIIKMRNKYPEYYYSQTNLGTFYKQGYAFCDTEIYQGVHWGEDYVFCRRARAAGNLIWLDKTIVLSHAGV
jgi:hypothetical protein